MVLVFTQHFDRQKKEGSLYYLLQINKIIEMLFLTYNEINVIFELCLNSFIRFALFFLLSLLKYLKQTPLGWFLENICRFRQ